MRLAAMDIPDDRVQLSGWLESHLVNGDLAILVAELSAVHAAPPGPGATAQQVLGDRRAEVLARGLGAMPPHLLRQFLTQPALLLDLQELVLASGSPYWDRLLGSTVDFV